MAQNQFVLLHEDGQYLSINDGNHWICVPDRMAATVLTETKANNILQNMIKPKEREHWRLTPFSDQGTEVEKTVAEEIPQEEVPAFEVKPPQKKSTRKKKVSEKSKGSEIEKTVEAQPAKVVLSKAHTVPVQENPDTLIEEWMKRADSMKQEYERLVQRKKDLAEELRQVSAELCDLEHYIEFHSLNAVKGYRIYRQLRDCLIRRRKIKDELMCITIFLKAEPHNILNGNLVRQFSGLRTREYAPRVLADLFAEELSPEEKDRDRDSKK
ncbi:MAG: hypothetical protein ACOX6P_05155 [Candidatus Merdivicinus sp.]|jgi:hypothetical protein